MRIVVVAAKNTQNKERSDQRKHNDGYDGVRNRIFERHEDLPRISYYTQTQTSAKQIFFQEIKKLPRGSFLISYFFFQLILLNTKMYKISRIPTVLISNNATNQ